MPKFFKITVKSFEQWLHEASIEDTDTEGVDLKDDPKLEDEQQKDNLKKTNICPRCGKTFPCICQDKDSMDIYTSNRFTGKKKSKKQ